MQRAPRARVRGPRAFTLVELLVVIGIIAVLVALLLPSLNKARQQSRKVKCLSNLKQIGAAVLMYAGENKGQVPVRLWNYVTPRKNGLDATSTFGPGVGFVAPPGGPNANGPALLVKNGPRGNAASAYLENNDIFFCPEDEVRAPYRSPVNGWGPTRADTLAMNSLSQSYWHYYFPDRHWNRTSGVQLAAPDDRKNSSVSTKDAAKKFYWADQYIPEHAAAAVTDQYKSFHKDGMNALYLDGHAHFINHGAFKTEMILNPAIAPPNFYAELIIVTANKNY